MKDIAVREAAALEVGLLTTGTVGALAVATSGALTGTTPEDLMKAIIKAGGAIETALDGGPADRVVMDSATFAWMSSYVTANHPIIGAGFNAAAPGSHEYGPGVRAVLPTGMGVIVSNGMPLDGASKHQVLVVPSSECYLWEEPVQYIRAEQPLAQKLGIELVVYQYAHSLTSVMPRLCN